MREITLYAKKKQIKSDHSGIERELARELLNIKAPRIKSDHSGIERENISKCGSIVILDKIRP